MLVTEESRISISRTPLIKCTMEWNPADASSAAWKHKRNCHPQSDLLLARYQFVTRVVADDPGEYCLK